jgi:hypothetical protein
LTKKTAKEYRIEWYGTLIPCEGCGTAKAKQKAVSKTTNVKATRQEERIFLDAAGPYHETIVGNKYWFKGVDDYSRFGCDKFFHVKSKMVAFAESLILKLKGQGMPEKYLRCDNAGEKARPLRALCELHGITIEFTAPDTPQQNGVVERCIAVLTQRANMMMMAANMKEEGRKVMWAEAVNTANTLENITPTSANAVTAYEMLMKRKSGLLPYVHPFERLGIVTIWRRFHGKWKEKGKKMMLISFAADHMGDTYKMFDPIAKTMRLSQDIKWLEWKIPDPYREMSILNQQQDTESDPGIDDKEYPPPHPLVRRNQFLF